MVEALEEAFGPYDAIAAPTLSTVAYPIGVDFDKVYTAYPGAVDLISAGNATGLPAVGLPNGFGVHGLPSGLSFLGRPFGEAKLTQIASGFQAQTDWHRRRPIVSTAREIEGCPAEG